MQALSKSSKGTTDSTTETMAVARFTMKTHISGLLRSIFRSNLHLSRRRAFKMAWSDSNEALQFLNYHNQQASFYFHNSWHP